MVVRRLSGTTEQGSLQCTECGWTTARWVGRCGECQVWNSVVERDAPKLMKVAAVAPSRST